jgi:CAI-1 autoinducer synthase
MQTIDIAPVKGRGEPPLTPHLRQRIARDFIPRWTDEWGSRPIVHGKPAGPQTVRLDGNDYLAVSGHPQIVQAQVDALRMDHGHVVQSGAFLLNDHPSYALEQSLAAWIGKEDGMLCQSGYAANTGLIQAIADASTPVYVDTMAHTSLWEGVRAAHAPGHPFRHNDPAHLDRMLQRHGPGLVIVDSVYSTTGALCPLVEILDVVEKHGAMILVDESHSLGTHGPQGAGLCAGLGVTHRVHFITASLAKAFAGRAGYFTMPREMRYFVLSESFPNIFSSCLLPHEIAGLAATLEVVKRADDARVRLHANTRRLRAAFDNLGYPIGQGSEQIIALEAGLERDTIALRDTLEENNVYGAVFCAPATSRNRALVRLTLSAALTEAEMTHVENVAREIAPRVRPWDWPIARRQRAAALS